MADLRLVSGGRLTDPADVEVGFVVEGGGKVRRGLVDVADVAFEQVPAVRSFPSYRGQRNYPGLYWAACTGAHVGFESWLERDEAMALDFDASVVGFAAQPFWLWWPVAKGLRSHAPDFFARHQDGTGVVIDCRPAERIAARDAAAFQATARACDLVEWDYRLVSGHDAVWLANLRWLAGYRHPRHLDVPVAARLLDLFSSLTPLMEGAAQVGDPIAVLPVLYHLLWSQRLSVDMAVRLDATSVVVRTGS
ncbi:TnsA-like heteromeric transposase endonuclease subunit [Micromonospora sp. NPDC000089]|uniref:TnsA-like heteromeric transposase endonuclease subunit n=1 Tax=unclassified Micromonospora TaxID=2617518 RepID=UPI003687F3E9